MLSWLRGESAAERTARLELDRKVTLVHKEAVKGWVSIAHKSRSSMAADRKAVYTGDGYDFFQAVPYDPELHDTRKIMWRQSAARWDGELIAKVTKPEVQAAVYAGFDISKTLDFGMSRETKLWLMARLGVTLCYSLKDTQDLLKPMLYANNSVGWLTTRPVFPNQISRRLATEILDPIGSDGQQDSGMLHMLNCVPKTRRSEVIIFSDFLNMTQEQEEALVQTAKRHSVRAVVIQDNRERYLPESPWYWPFPAPLRVFDLSDGHQYTWWTTASNRAKYTAEFERHEARLKAFFKKAHISYAMFNTNEGPEATRKMLILLAQPPLAR